MVALIFVLGARNVALQTLSPFRQGHQFTETEAFGLYPSLAPPLNVIAVVHIETIKGKTIRYLTFRSNR